MTRLTVTQAQGHFAEALDRVCRRGERIVLTQNGKKIAVLVSVEDMARLASLESRTAAGRSRRAPCRLLASELMKQPRKERERILAASASRAAQVYRDNPGLTDFEAFGDEDFAE